MQGSTFFNVSNIAGHGVGSLHIWLIVLANHGEMRFFYSIVFIHTVALCTLRVRAVRARRGFFLKAGARRARGRDVTGDEIAMPYGFMRFYAAASLPWAPLHGSVAADPEGARPGRARVPGTRELK